MEPSKAAARFERRGEAQGGSRGGFTLIEVTVVSVIVIIIAALIFVAVGPLVRQVRSESERQLLRSLVVATDAFKQRFGALPPLVDDASPVVTINPLGASTGTPTFVVRAVSGTGFSSNQFLAYTQNAGASRSSVFSAPIFLLGVLPGRVDGVDGPGMTPVDVTALDGSVSIFNITGAATSPLFDVSSVKERLLPSNTLVQSGTERIQQIVDRWGNPIRYYRWLPTRHVPLATPVANVYTGWDASGSFTAGAMSNDTARAGEVRSYNVPVLLGNPYANPDLRGASYAFVSAGPDGQLNDALPPNRGVNADNIVEVGK